MEGTHFAYVDNMILESNDGSYVSPSLTIITSVTVLDNDEPRAGLVAPSPYEVWEGDTIDLTAYLAAPADQAR